ncbi:dienelactone hydrolase family protein [Corynebacterium sp. A21]|uniref:dienelactone hydrolase family protein n=1 Tax=Corynebacterium sp. A21 TaxID=3457318 RepID=UPI003FD1D78F
MSENLKKHLAKLSKRGPHRVLVGSLDYAGIEGKVYTPAKGNGVPAIAFGHDWMKGIDKYHVTLRHLASWGIVVAAPNTEKSFLPDHRGFASDLESCLQILAGVKLGQGHVTVSPGKLGIVGHGMGGGAAILAATDSPKVKAVAALYPAVTTPSAEAAAQHITHPGLIIGSGQSGLVDAGNPARIAANWAGPMAYRELSNGNQMGFTEDTLFKLTLGIGRPQFAGQELARGLLTGFLLHRLDNEHKYAAFSAAEATAKNVTSYTGDELKVRADMTPMSR